MSPLTSFYDRFRHDIDDLLRYGGRQQFVLKTIDLTTAQFDVDLQIQPCTSIVLLKDTLIERNLVSSNGAVIYLEINDSGVLLPFSLAAGSSYFTNLTTTIRKIKVTNTVASPNQKIFLLLTLGVAYGSSGSVGGSTGGAGGGAAGGGGDAPPAGGGGL